MANTIPNSAGSDQKVRTETDLLKRLNFHLENSPVCVTEWDKNFVLTYWSPQAEKTFGWKAEEVVGKTPYEFGFIYPDDMPAVDDVNRRMNRGVDARSISYNRNRDKHGKVHYCEWYNSALLDDRGEISSIFAIVLDVTDRHEAQEALRAREEFLRLAYEASGMWLWEVNLSTEAVRWPEPSPAVYGSSAGTKPLMLSEWMEHVHPEDRQRLRDAHDRAVNEGGQLEIEFRVLQADGTLRWVYNRGNVFRDQHGEPSRMIGVGMDVTARKQAEEALKESEERLRLAFDAAYLGAWDWNIKSGELKWHGHHEKMFGFAPGTFDGRYETFLNVIHPEDRAAAVALIQRALAEKRQEYRNEFRVLWPDGSVHWILAQGRFYFNENGDPVRLVGVDVDLTERKLGEESLRSSETRLSLAQRAAKMGTWEMDLRTFKSVWSDELWAVYGLETNSCEPNFDSWLRTVHPDERELRRRQVLHFTDTRQDIDFEYRCLWPDGTVRWLAGLGTLLYDENGAPRSMVGVNMDVTDRKRSEEALRMSDRLAATGRMAASLAHEINNPLASVTNLLYLLEQEPLGEQARMFVSIASAELGRVAHITKNILGLYRESPVPVEVDVCEVLDDVVAFYKSKIESLGVAVRKSYRADGRVPGFPGELRQVFANLVANAIEAMNGEGTLAVRLSKAPGTSSGVVVTLGDSGPGIPISNAQRVFEPFFTTKGEKGTGLGLWISKEIIRKHGGSIRVRTCTESGRSGTIFRVFLPRTQQPFSTSLAAGGSGL